MQPVPSRRSGKQPKQNREIRFFPNLFQTCEGRCIKQPAALKAPHWNLTVWCRMHVRGGGDLFFTASGPVSTVLRCSGGSILVLVRDLAPYAALLCCYEPCRHDPRRCGLNSCPSYTPIAVSVVNINHVWIFLFVSDCDFAMLSSKTVLSSPRRRKGS